MKPWWIGSALVLGISAAGISADLQGDPAAGRDAFSKLRCDSCHSVYRAPKARIPLRDLSKETPESVTNMIFSRTELVPGALLDEMAMSAAASRMTRRELADIVAYLRTSPPRQ